MTTDEDADLQLATIELGFDIRLHGHIIGIPLGTTSASYEIDGMRFVVRGSREHIAETLRQAGYVVAVSLSE